MQGCILVSVGTGCRGHPYVSENNYSENYEIRNSEGEKGIINVLTDRVGTFFIKEKKYENHQNYPDEIH